MGYSELGRTSDEGNSELSIISKDEDTGNFELGELSDDEQESQYWAGSLVAGGKRRLPSLNKI